MADYVEKGVPFFRSKEVIERYKGNAITTELYITEEHYQTIKDKFGAPEEGHILLTSVGTLGIPYQVQANDKFYFKDGNLTWFKEFGDAIDAEFLFYWLTSPIAKRKFDEITIGSTQKALTIVALKGIEIDLPPKTIQKQVVKIVKSLDRKLSNNRGVNQTLEQMAQAIFKSWFVDFDPVKAKMNGEQPEGMDAATASLFPEKLVESELGLIPEGWEVKPLGDVSTFQNGYAFKSKELTTDTTSTTHKVFKMGNIRKGGGFNSKGSKDYFNLNSNPKVERYLIKKGDLLMSMTDMKNNVALLGHTALMPVSDEYLVNQRVGLIRKSDKHYLNYPFLYYQTNEPLFLTDIRSRANSGVQVNLSTKGIKDTLLVVPPKEIHNAFDKQVSSFLEMIFSNDKQSEELASLRDLLLPKLLSGEIELAETTI